MNTTTPAPDLERRFGGLARLYGAAGAQRIRQAHAVVVGVGGVGAWAAEALARSGVARLSLIDLDHIAESNINRQIHALQTTLGQAKVEAMRERIAQIHPGCQVDCIEAFAEPGNWPELLNTQAQWAENTSAQPRVVIDACDQVRAKTAMAAWALQQRDPFISIGAAGGKRWAHQVDLADLAQVTHDPLLAKLRYDLRKQHGAPRQGKIGLACVFSRETVARPATEPASACAAPDASPAASDNSLNCHGYGSVVSVTATFGLCAAGWALNQLAEAP